MRVVVVVEIFCQRCLPTLASTCSAFDCQNRDVWVALFPEVRILIGGAPPGGIALRALSEN